MLPDWQQHNLRRILGDSIAIASAILMAIVLHLATDDDDEEVINSTWYNLILYQADRWATFSYLKEIFLYYVLLEDFKILIKIINFIV